jgi:hypothetical protein
MGYLNMPARCKQCKLTAGAAFPSQDSDKPCYKFLSGNCPFGDNCRFSHEADTFPSTPSKTVNMATASPTADPESENTDEEAFEIDRPRSGPMIRWDTNVRSA